MYGMHTTSKIYICVGKEICIDINKIIENNKINECYKSCQVLW